MQAVTRNIQFYCSGLNVHMTLTPMTSREMHECKAELDLLCRLCNIMQSVLFYICPKEGSHEPMMLASTTETLIKYLCTRCLTAYRGHNMYCKNSPLDCMPCPVFVSRTSG